MINAQIISHEKQTEDIIKSAISAKLKRLELGLNKTTQHIKAFEEKYKVSSSIFLKKYSAEDLEGKDIEYVHWSGEIKMKERLLIEIKKLKNIEYVSK